MNQNRTKKGWTPVIAVFFGFFIMGFVDVVGIATNYVKIDFNLSNSLANTLPMIVFLWFALFSIPAGILMGKVGRKKTVLISLSITTFAMVIPFIIYSFAWVLVAFALLGISNTILQVSLNPLVASMFNNDKTASVLTTGQFIKSVSSLLGPIIVGFTALYFANWRFTFLIFAIISLLSVLLLSFSKIDETGYTNRQSSFRSVISLLKNRYILYSFLGIVLIVGLDVGINTSAPQLLMSRADLEISRAGLGSSVYFIAKTIGTFLGAFLLLKTRPLRFLRVSLLIATLSFIPLIFGSNLWAILIAIFVIGLSCANVFSILFSLALNKLTDRSNGISALMIMGVSGGAVILPLQGVVNDAFGLIASLLVLLSCLILNLLFTQKLKENA
ncbi:MULTISPECIES: MFS transporter [Proteiniphilum]|jgi:fucose permease|uniref:MFS transporter n=1 Tax=Proteiniphilum TaxID=294702 RepID=UPI001EEA14E4|nr:MULTISPECIES: MFS transporter [Proteiniphilum]ULB33533.1 MFS transporter [Proteiniphilum propionicum]